MRVIRFDGWETVLGAAGLPESLRRTHAATIRWYLEGCQRLGVPVTVESARAFIVSAEAELSPTVDQLEAYTHIMKRPGLGIRSPLDNPLLPRPYQKNYKLPPLASGGWSWPNWIDGRKPRLLLPGVIQISREPAAEARKDPFATPKLHGTKVSYPRTGGKLVDSFTDFGRPRLKSSRTCPATSSICLLRSRPSPLTFTAKASVDHRRRTRGR